MNINLLTGPNLMLRALEPRDVETLYEWENDTSIWKVSNTLTPFSKFHLEDYVLNTQHDIFASKQLRLMVVLLKPDEANTPVGTIDLFDFDPFHFRAGVGIMIREIYREKGYAREAMEIIIQYGFEVLRLHQVYCNISPDNLSSLHLFEKLGFVKCAVKRDWINEGEQWKEEWMFQLINQNG
ncbi:MAG: GNAT family N-acetyltransferase [Bacteroidota bacterium]